MALVVKYIEKEPTPFAQVILRGPLVNTVGNTEKFPKHKPKITADRFAYNF